MERMSVTFLGTGTSQGVPIIACDCEVCTSDDPRDKRSRPSIAIRIGEQVILIDTTPDLRQQCLDRNIRRLDAVLYTHAHADHIVGLDDLRRFNAVKQGHIDAYGDADAVKRISRMFYYAMDNGGPMPPARPWIRMHVVDDQFELLGIPIIPIRLMHADLPILGFRIGDFAYCTDASFIPDESLALLGGLDVLVLNALRFKPHPAHLSVQQAVDLGAELGARWTYLTHMTHDISHARDSENLPDGVRFAYDGLRVVTAIRA
jgi:phosphoribosyl 1,2-cyclic phosphate phosphodiesterase